MSSGSVQISAPQIIRKESCWSQSERNFPTGKFVAYNIKQIITAQFVVSFCCISMLRITSWLQFIGYCHQTENIDCASFFFSLLRTRPIGLFQFRIISELWIIDRR
jgi:hypothetical protein